MTDTSDLKRRAARISGFLDTIEEAKEDLKVERKAAKDAGYDVKALAQAIREMRADKDKVEKQLAFEFVLDTYRAGLGLKTRDALGAGSEADAEDGTDSGVVPFRGKLAAAGA